MAAGREGTAAGTAAGTVQAAPAAGPARQRVSQPARQRVSQPARQRVSQTERRARSERRIIQATLQAIAEKGVAGASLAEIGERAGYSRGLPAHLFGNKDRLLAECLKQLMLDLWLQHLPEVPAHGAFAALAAAIRKWLHDLVTHPELSRAHFLLLQEANVAEAPQTYPQLVPLIRDFVAGSEQRFRHYIEAGQAAGEIAADLDAEFEATLIHTTLRGISLRWLIGPGSIDIARFADRYLERLERQMLERRRGPAAD